MIIKSGKILIEFTVDELYTMAWDTFKSLEQSCNSHYKNHAEHVFFDQESSTLERMKTFFQLSGHPDLYMDQVEKLQAILRK